MPDIPAPIAMHAANGQGDTNGKGDKALPRTMTGAIVTAFNQPVEIQSDIEVPNPDAGQILVRVKACSLCMSDIAGISGGLPYPVGYVAGHEPVGVVAALPPTGIPGWSVGDRIGFMPASKTCGQCDSCLRGNHRFCEKRTNVGFMGRYGGFSEYCLADPMSSIKIPNGISDEEAAPMLCAGVTAYAAVKKVSLAQPGGTLVNIIGCGGVGHLAIQYAKKMGFDVHAFDIADDKIQLALDCGADKAFNSMSTEITPDLKAQSTIVISGAGPAYASALKATKSHGRIICVGVPPKDIAISMMTMILQDVALIPTNQGNRLELYESLQLAVKLGIKPVIERRSLDQLNDGIDDLKKGKVNGRLVYQL